MSYIKAVFKCTKCDNRVVVVETDHKPIPPKCHGEEMKLQADIELKGVEDE